MDRNGRRLVALTAVALALVGSACGSRIDHETLLADARGGPAVTGPGETGVPGAPQVQATGAPAAGPSGGATEGVQSSTATPVGPSVGPTRSTTATTRTSASGAPSATAVGVRPSGATAGGASGTPVGPGGQAGGPVPTVAPGPGAPSTPASCTGKEPPISIGTVSNLSGLVGSILRPLVRGTQAWVATTNATGGLRCHRINYIVADDGGDPSRHQAFVHRQVEEDRIAAFVELAAILTGTTSVDYITSKRVPVVGGITSEPYFYQSPMYFPQMSFSTASWQSAAYAVGDAGRLTGKTKLGTLYCLETPQCTEFAKAVADTAPKAGIKLVFSRQISITQPSYLSECQAAKDAGAEILFPSIDASGMSRIERSCSTVGYHPQYFMHSLNADATMSGNSGLDGMAVMTGLAPWFQSDNPAVAQYLRDLKQYAPEVEPGPGTMIGWASGKLFEKAVLATSADPTTSAGILEGLWTVKGDDLNGLAAPLTFRRDQTAVPVVCYWLAQTKGGHWISPNNGKRTCV